MNEGVRSFELADLGAVRVHGADAVRFLQGQLSSDVQHLTAERSQLAGVHNPQGRTVALLRLVRLGQDDILAVLPRELATTVAARLGRYVLRSKVKLADESAGWSIRGLLAPNPEAGSSVAGFALPAELHGQTQAGDLTILCVGRSPPRWMILSPADRAPPQPDCAAGDREEWRRFDVAEGWPQVYPATSEAFVAQMLNLDVIGAIAFDKGCYTGQEVIARAHYRGRVKRRMQRFRTRDACRLQPGDSGVLGDGRSFKVVEAVALSDGRCEFLAVAPLGAAEREPEAPGTDSGTTVIDAETLDLPYSLSA